MDQQTHDLLTVGIAQLFLLGADLAQHNGIDNFQVRRIGG